MKSIILKSKKKHMSSLKPIYEIFKKIEKEPGRNKKIEYIKEVMNTEHSSAIKDIVNLALSPSYVYKIEKTDSYKPYGLLSQGWPVARKNLIKVSSKRGITKLEKSNLFQSAMIDPETYDIFCRICKKDLRLGIASTTFQKLYPDLELITPYMRCATSAYIDCIKYPACVQTKEDGEFINIIVTYDEKDKEQVTFKTRNGITVDLDHLQDIICGYLGNERKESIKNKKAVYTKDGIYSNVFNNRVYMGELLCIRNKKVLSRQEGNGIITKCIRKTISEEEKKLIHVKLWDCVSYNDFKNLESVESYELRLYLIEDFCKNINSKYFSIIDYKIVDSKEDAYKYFRIMKKTGKEGVIVKNLNVNSKWEHNLSGSRNCIKIKTSFEVDMEVIGWNKGKEGKKFSNSVGSIKVASRDRKVVVNVSGLTDVEREMDWDKEIGSIVTIEAGELIQSKNSDTYSLYLPQYICKRFDKNKANTLEEIQEIGKESKATNRKADRGIVRKQE